MPTVSRLRRWLAAVLIVILTATVLSPVEASTRATAELQHPRQRFLRSSTAGLFLHWTSGGAPNLDYLEVATP